MGLFAKLGFFKNKNQTLRLDTQAELTTLEKEGRLHKRVKIADPSLASLTMGESTTLRIIDLSYGGIAVLLPTSLMISKSIINSGRICIINRSIDIKLTLLRTSPFTENQVLAAFGFAHDSPDFLLFLREFIEPSRFGESIALIAPILRQERYNHKDWHCFRGEGPVDLLLRCEPDSVTPAEFLLTFRIQENYWDLGYQNGQLGTRQAANSSKSALDLGVDSAIPTGVLDPYVLRTAIFILTACSAKHKELTQPIIELAKAALNQSVSGT